MKIIPSTAKKQCDAHDIDCAPPVRCELEAGHEAEHQWSYTRTVPLPRAEDAKPDDEVKTKEEPGTKKFSTEPKQNPVLAERPAPAPSKSDVRVAEVLKKNTK